MYPRVSRHLIRNMDALRKQRRGIKEDIQGSQDGKPSEIIANVESTEAQNAKETEESETEKTTESAKDNVE